MKPFHYNQDPLYTAAAAILTGQPLNEEDEMNEAARFNMGTATITRAGHTLDGKKVHIFKKFDDGRINAQYVKSDKKGDVLNLTLKQDEYVLNEAASGADFYLLPGHVINNELFVAARNLNSMQSSLKNGNDFDLKGFKNMISILNDIAKQAKRFKTGDEIPVSYQYKAKYSKATSIESVEESKSSDDDWEGENPSMWNPKERKELYAALASGKKIPLAKFMTLAHNYYKKSAKDHALNNLMTMTDQGTVNDVENMFGLGLKLKGGNVFATKIK
jgi:nucleoid DNA-binding protein